MGWRRDPRTSDPRAVAYVFGGAGTEDTVRANEGGVPALADRPTDAPERLRARPLGLAMAVSTVSASPLDEIAAAAPSAKWFQLYWPNDRELAASRLARAEKAAYGAVIVTLDTFLPGWKPRDLQGAWQPREFVVQFSNLRLTWEDLEFLRARTSLPIAGDELGVLLDSGVRSGADVFKALALGADAVLLERPYLRGFAAGGERGVLSVLRAILAELDLTIGLSGHARPAELGVGALVRGC